MLSFTEALSKYFLLGQSQRGIKKMTEKGAIMELNWISNLTRISAQDGQELFFFSRERVSTIKKIKVSLDLNLEVIINTFIEKR